MCVCNEDEEDLGSPQIFNFITFVVLFKGFVICRKCFSFISLKMFSYSATKKSQSVYTIMLSRKERTFYDYQFNHQSSGGVSIQVM